MSNLIPFSFENRLVRTTIINNEPWFIAVDVCTSLDIKNSRMAIKRLADDEKGVINIDTLGGKQEIAIISEPGLYSLIRRSNKPEARRFDRWICHEVLPTIRKTGSYSNDTVGIEGYSELKELNKLIGNILEYRFVLTFDENKKPHIRILSYDNLIISIENLPKMINNKLTLSEELLLKIMQAYTKRLTLMASCREIQTRLDKSS